MYCISGQPDGPKWSLGGLWENSKVLFTILKGDFHNATTPTQL
jgi:hypothetical protein